MRNTLANFTWRWRWWKWLLGGPNIAKLIASGWTKESRMMIYNRHWASEPKKPTKND